MAIQTYSSAMTSINSTKLPAIYNKLDWNKIKYFYRNQNQINILDYGCGKYTDHIQEFCQNIGGINWLGYDYTWNPDKKLLCLHYDVIICSNVLNVIKEYDIIHGIRIFIQDHAKMYFITVYEGDGTGIGRETKSDCWQRNEKTEIYMYHSEVIRKKVITKPLTKIFIK